MQERNRPNTVRWSAVLVTSLIVQIFMKDISTLFGFRQQWDNLDEPITVVWIVFLAVMLVMDWRRKP